MKSMTMTGTVVPIFWIEMFRRNAPCHGFFGLSLNDGIAMGDGGTGSAFWTFGRPWLHDSLRYHRASPLQVETQRSKEVKRAGKYCETRH